MVDTGRQDDQIPRLHPDPHPPILRIPDVEIPSALQDVSDFLVLVHVFVVKHFDLVLVDRAHGAGRHGNLVPAGVVPGLDEAFDLGGG